MPVDPTIAAEMEARGLSPAVYEEEFEVTINAAEAQGS